MFNSYGMSECWFILTCFVCCTRRHTNWAWHRHMPNLWIAVFLFSFLDETSVTRMTLIYWAPDILIWDLYSDEANHHLPASFHWFYKDSTSWRAECFPLTCDFISVDLISRSVPAIRPANIVTRWICPLIWTIHFLYCCLYSISKDTSGTYR